MRKTAAESFRLCFMDTLACVACHTTLTKTPSRGLCNRCYMAAWKNGTLEEVALPPRPRSLKKKYPPGHRVVLTTGYVNVVNDYGGQQAEHRLVMERHIGRPLVKGESVHHINGDRADNRLENLELWFKPQPAGQRVEQAVAYVLEYHQEALTKAGWFKVV